MAYNNDRYCTVGGRFTGDRDKREADAFKTRVRGPHGMVEWSQDHFTCNAKESRSRIDRVYTNQHLSYQLDKHITCTTLEWDKISTHRPLVFGRTTAKPKAPGLKPIPLSVIQKEGWKQTVATIFNRLCANDPSSPNPCRCLVLLKDAIREAYENLSLIHI